MAENTVAETVETKPKKAPRIPVASIHSHFNIFRNIHEQKTGDVTIEEQVTALARFVRWHERQVEVGKQLLAELTVKAEGGTR